MKKITNEDKKLLNLKDLSITYGFPLTTLRRYASERRFPLYRVSNRILVSIDEFEGWLKKFHFKGDGN